MAWVFSPSYEAQLLYEQSRVLPRHLSCLSKAFFLLPPGMPQKDEKGHVLNTGVGESVRLLEGHYKGKIKEVSRRELRGTPGQADDLLFLPVRPPPTLAPPLLLPWGYRNAQSLHRNLWAAPPTTRQQGL